ncbi:MAG: TolC family protein [Planctomycetota bacterium]
MATTLLLSKRRGATFALILLSVAGPAPRAQDPVDPANRSTSSAGDVAQVALPVDPDAGAPFPITLDEALQIGFRQNTALRVSEIGPFQAAEDVRAARAIFEPELFGEATIQRTEDPTRNVFQPEITRLSYNGRFGVRQLVPSGGLFDLSYAPTRLEQTTNIPGFPTRQFTNDFTATYTQPLLRGAWSDYTQRDIRTRERQKAATELRHLRTVQDTLIAIVNAYWDFVFARENYRVVFQALELARQQLARTERRIQVGDLAPLDRVADEAEVARRREELVIAENEIRDREDDLRRLLFDDRDGLLWRRGLLPTTPIGQFPDAPDLDWRSLVQIALRARPDVRAGRADVAIAEIGATTAARDVLPQLDLVGSYTTNSTRDRFSDAWDDVFGLGFPDWSIQLELSVPIGNQAALAARDRAKLEVERTQRTLIDLEYNVHAQVRDAVRQLRTLAESISRNLESVRLAETNLDREIAREQAGTSTQFEVQERNQELQEARSRLLRNQLDYRKAEANLHYVDGTLAVAEEPDRGEPQSGDPPAEDP